MLRVYGPLRLVLLLTIFGLLAPSAIAQRTSACYENDPNQGCFGRFKGMKVSHDAKEFNQPASDEIPAGPTGVSTISIKEFFRFPETPAFVHFLPWFEVGPTVTLCPKKGDPQTLLPNPDPGEYPQCGPQEADPEGDYTSFRSHVEVGYNSDDPFIIARQLSDIKRRGFDGLVVNWFGPNPRDGESADPIEKNATDEIARQVDLRYPEAADRLLFAVMEDHGSFRRPYTSPGPGKCLRANDPGEPHPDQGDCIREHLTLDFNYMRDNFLSRPSYLKVLNNNVDQLAGQPVTQFFVDQSPTGTNPWVVDDWTAVWEQLRLHTDDFGTLAPLFLFRNSPGFDNAQSDGAYAWVATSTTGSSANAFNVLENFYQRARAETQNSTGKQVWGAGFKGFDDRKAGFAGGPGDRFVNQECGTLWLDSMERANSQYMDVLNQPLPFFHAVTWNDYEEGTAIESGIDNCLSHIEVSTTGTHLVWTVHYAEEMERILETIHQFELRRDSTAEVVAVIAKDPNCSPFAERADCSFPLSSLPVVENVRLWAVGKPSIISLGSADTLSLGEIRRPTADVDDSSSQCAGAYQPSTALPYAYDDDDTTASGLGSSGGSFSGSTTHKLRRILVWSPPDSGYSSLNLKIKSACSVGGLGGGGSNYAGCSLEYSLNGGSNWNTVYSTNVSRSLSTDTIALPPSQPFADLVVRACAWGTAGSFGPLGYAALPIYDVRTEGVGGSQ